MIDRFLKTRYKEGGRGPREYDCWGLTRIARAELFWKSLLPSYDNIHPDDKPALTDACSEVRDTGFKPVPAKPGAIATGWVAGLCIHVGLVVMSDGRQWVLETTAQRGPTLTELPKFEKRYAKVVYYDD